MNIKNTFIGATLLAAFGAGTALPCAAQGTQANNSSVATPAAQAQAADMRVSEMLGKEVQDAQGKNVGKIEDVIVDTDNERVRYVLLSFGGMLGIGDKLFSFPASALQTGKNGEQLVLNITKEQLEKAPGFERNRRPNFSDETYRSTVDRFFFKEEISRHTPSGARLVAASDLIGKEVNDRAAHSIGEVEDLVVNLGTGRAYTVMNVDKGMVSGGKLVPLPFAAIMVPPRPDLDLILSMDRKVLENAQGFENGKWPDLRSTQYQKRITEQLAAFHSKAKVTPSAAQTGREPALSEPSSGSSR